jgi:putative oxidoreductase
MNTTSTPHIEHPLHHSDPESAALEVKEEERQQQAEHMRLKRWHTNSYSVGRVLLSLLFIVSALVKWAHFDATVLTLAERGFVDPTAPVVIAICVELIFGGALALGYRVRGASIVLIGYLSLVTLIVHSNLSSDFNRAQALTNLAFIGGLLMLIGHGPGAHSVDRFLARRNRRQAA